MRCHLLLPLALAACTPATAATRGFPVGGFDRIDSAGSIEVQVRTGAAPTAVATGDQEVLDRLVVEVRGGVLHVGLTPYKVLWHWGVHGPTIVAVTVPTLRGATLTGSGGVHVDRVRTARFEGLLTGSGNLDVGTLEAGDATFTLTGSGDVKVGGRVERAELAMRGSGDLDAHGLAVVDAVVDATGSGSTIVTATRTARVTLAGSGDVTVRGGARCQTSKHGSGDVRCG